MINNNAAYKYETPFTVPIIKLIVVCALVKKFSSLLIVLDSGSVFNEAF